MKFYPSTILSVSVAGLLVIFIGASSAQAGPDQFGSATIEEPNGFPGVCDQPCYTVTKSYEVWYPSNPDNPLPLAGNNTYIYKLVHEGGLGPFVPAVLQFELEVDTSMVTAAGHIATSPGVAPTLETIDTVNAVVTWDFAGPTLNDGETTKLLYVHSPLDPGTLSDNMISVSAQAGLDAPGTCIGPFVEKMEECSLIVEKEGCVVQPPDPGGDACQGRATAFSFVYTGLGCDATSHLQNPKKVRCIGGADGAEPVDIMVIGKKRKRWSWRSGWWGKKRRKKTVFASESGVNIGDTIMVDAANAGKNTLGSEVSVKISTGDGWHDVIEFDRFHTSCSQPLGPGNQFGSVSITSLTSTEGGTVTLPTDGQEDECITSIDTAPAPHCEGKITTLQLRYTGGDCGATMTSQSSDKVGCFDIAPPTLDPVRIIISDGAAPPPSTTAYLDQSPVNGGDILTVESSSQCSNHSHNHLKSVTGYWIKNAITGELIQDGFFHTSCSQPLNLGDQIGGLQVFALDTTEGGSVALGGQVDYTYVVTNPNDSTVDNVTVDDDILGNIASGVSIPAGESQTFMTSALIEVETTNVVTVNGDVGGNMCSEATDTATITVEEPPDEPTICTKKIAAALLKYTGPTILGATVEFEAKSFQHDTVTYGPIDLVNGVVLSDPAENGFSIDGTAHGETDLGSKLKIFINGVEEELHTSCSVPFESDSPAPLNNPSGAPSSNWFVVDFTEKQ